MNRECVKLFRPSGTSKIRRHPKIRAVRNCCFRSLSSSQQQSSPPPAATTAEGDLPRDKWRAGDLSTPPRPIFPWRHDPEPLPRLVGESAQQGGKLGPGLPTLTPVENFIVSFFCTQAGAVVLNIPWYQRLLSSQWKHELAEAGGWAFAQAVAGVLSNTYRVPFDGIVTSDSPDEDGGLGNSINFDHTTKFRTAMEENEDIFSHADYMMDEKLIHLYEAAHDSGKEQMRILLQTRPLSSKLESIFVVPCLTRTAVEESPALRHTYRNMANHFVEIEEEMGRELGVREVSARIKDQIVDLVRQRVKIHPDGYGVLEHTVIAQVLVMCDEVFGVRDLLTEKMVQGDGVRRTVPHLVRLEMVVESHLHRSAPATNHLGSWKITDWDDLLGGNIWFA